MRKFLSSLVLKTGCLLLGLLLKIAKRKPAFVQNRCYATTGWDKAVRDICKKQGIRYQGFSLLTANRKILATPAFLNLTVATGCTGAQLIFAFAKHMGMLPLIGSTKIKHLQEDQAAMGLALSADALKVIENIAV